MTSPWKFFQFTGGGYESRQCRGHSRMPTPPQGSAYQSSPCYWDKLFTTRREFDPNSENQLYIEIWKGQEDDVDGDSDYGADDKTEIKKEDDGSDDSDNTSNSNYDENNVVRTFMMDEGDILYLDQTEVIEGFVKGASLSDLQSKTQLEN